MKYGGHTVGSILGEERTKHGQLGRCANMGVVQRVNQHQHAEHVRGPVECLRLRDGGVYSGSREGVGRGLHRCARLPSACEELDHGHPHQW